MAVIAFVGSFGSGCTAISEILVKEHKYKSVSLDVAVRGDFFKTKKKNPGNRVELYDFADEQRMRQGTDYYAKMALDSLKGGGANLIINDMKHADEVLYAKRKFPKIIIFGIYTETADRWERLKDAYKGDKRAFEQDDRREQGINDDSPYRQSMNKCFAKSNVILRTSGGVIASGNPHTEALKAILLAKIAYYTKYPPSESKPEIIDVMPHAKGWKWNFGPQSTMVLALSLAAIIGGGLLGVIGYAISPGDAQSLTTFTHVGIGAKVGAVVCLIGLIVYGEMLRRQKPNTADEDSEDR